MHKIAYTTFPTKECSDQGFFSTTSLATEISFPMGRAKMQRLAQMGAFVHFLHETFNNWPLCHPYNLSSFTNKQKHF